MYWSYLFVLLFVLASLCMLKKLGRHLITHPVVILCSVMFHDSYFFKKFLISAECLPSRQPTFFLGILSQPDISPQSASRLIFAFCCACTSWRILSQALLCSASVPVFSVWISMSAFPRAWLCTRCFGYGFDSGFALEQGHEKQVVQGNSQKLLPRHSMRTLRWQVSWGPEDLCSLAPSVLQRPSGVCFDRVKNPCGPVIQGIIPGEESTLQWGNTLMPSSQRIRFSGSSYMCWRQVATQGISSFWTKRHVSDAICRTIPVSIFRDSWDYSGIDYKLFRDRVLLPRGTASLRVDDRHSHFPVVLGIARE